MRRPLAVLCIVVALCVTPAKAGMPVVAQSQEPSPGMASARVTATIVDDTSGCTDDITEGRDPVTASPGRRVSCIQASDPRLTGRVVMDTLAVGGGMWMASVLVQTATGDWRGSASGYRDPDGTAVSWMMLSGAGGLAGLTAMLHVADGLAVGLVAQGELQDPPPPVEPARTRP